MTSIGRGGATSLLEYVLAEIEFSLSASISLMCALHVLVNLQRVPVS